MLPSPRLCLLSLALLAAGISAAYAQAPLSGSTLAPSSPMIAQPQTSVTAMPQTPIDERIAFNHAERWLIPYYFDDVRIKQRRAARDKTQPRALPAGLTVAPAKGDLLQPAVMAELRRLPSPLIRQLPKERPDTTRLIAGKDVLMLRRSTGEVLDVLGNAIR